MVDEFQDTNRPQYLLDQAARGEGTATSCVVGDDDQSIYGWRGADVRNILDFERDCPDAQVVKLEQNYRSTQPILDVAHAVVSKNVARTDKKLWTENPRGQLIERFEAYNEEEEAEWIVRRVEELTGGPGSVLTRRADDGPPYGCATSRSSTAPTPSPGPSRRRASATASATSWSAAPGSTRARRSRTPSPTCAILRSDGDAVSFERIINVPARAIGDKTIELPAGRRRRRRACPPGPAVERAAAGRSEGIGRAPVRRWRSSSS